MRIAWLTDPHFNHARAAAWDALIESLEGGLPDALLITGDISEGDDVVFQLSRLAGSFTGPIYFILGNHDFYQRSIAATRRQMVDACSGESRLVYLTNEFEIALSPNVGLVGDDGWGDATVGDYENSPVRLADFQHIDDFRNASPSGWKSQLQVLGQHAADRLRPKLEEALERFATVVVATHVPPFREACWYEGHTTDDLWAPFFVCGQIGDLLLETARQYPNRRVVVFCGHTHHGGTANLTDNLTVVTGGAEYGHPRLTGLLDVADNACRWSLAQ